MGLSPWLFSKAIKIIGQVIKTVSLVNDTEILLIFYYNQKHISGIVCLFNCGYFQCAAQKCFRRDGALISLSFVIHSVIVTQGHSFLHLALSCWGCTTPPLQGHCFLLLRLSQQYRLIQYNLFVKVSCSFFYTFVSWLCIWWVDRLAVRFLVRSLSLSFG